MLHAIPFFTVFLTALTASPSTASWWETSAPAQNSSPIASGEPLRQEGEPPAIGPSFTLFPPRNLYPTNVADPHRRGFGVQLIGYRSSAIGDAGDSRIALKLGGRFGLVRFAGEQTGQRQWQLGIEAGFYGQFDNDHSQDNVGWDGFYGLVLSTTTASGRGWKIGTLHTSSHLGDELIERTGRERNGYTRHELLVGISQPLGSGLRLYTEVGWGFSLRNEVQQPGRGQIGLVLERPETLLRSRLGWYAALDLSATEERSWRIDPALQIGVMHSAAYRCWRVGAEYYDGRPPLGEFFRDTESSFSFGLWLDL